MARLARFIPHHNIPKGRCFSLVCDELLQGRDKLFFLKQEFGSEFYDLLMFYNFVTIWGGIFMQEGLKI